MARADMVHLRTVHSGFHAQVIAARLGADGIVTQLKGSVSGPYPLGDVQVWVTEEDAESARELLLADEVEAAFDLPVGGETWSQRGRPVVLGLTRPQLLAAFGIVVLLWSTAFTRLFA